MRIESSSSSGAKKRRTVKAFLSLKSSLQGGPGGPGLRVDLGTGIHHVGVVENLPYHDHIFHHLLEGNGIRTFVRAIAF
jgi:hypothetical protein